MSKNISYKVVNCSYGKLLIAASSLGICNIKLGDNEAVLIKELKTEFSGFQLTPAGSSLEQYSKPLLDYLDNSTSLPEFPCDLTGTAFQKQVWQFLKIIPSGKTYSYSELAKAMGKPRSVRAIASACARNQIALLIPCHRVVPKSGGVGKYRWGSERKEKLLVAEKGSIAA